MIHRTPPFVARVHTANGYEKRKRGPIVSQQYHASPKVPLAFALTAALIIVILSLDTSIQAQIVSHNLDVANARPPSCCKACHATDSYRRKDIRRRNLRFISNCVTTLQTVVMHQPILLVRWQCKKCKFTFTDYPDFRPTL